MSYSGLLTWNTTFLCIQDIIMAQQYGFWRPPKKDNPLKKMQFNMQAIVWSTLAHDN